MHATRSNYLETVIIWNNITISVITFLIDLQSMSNAVILKAEEYFYPLKFSRRHESIYEKSYGLLKIIRLLTPFQMCRIKVFQISYHYFIFHV